MDAIVTTVGHPAYAATSLAMRSPTAIPKTPPRAVI
jgi:hypothetical protein